MLLGRILLDLGAQHFERTLVKADGSLGWNGESVPDEMLEARLEAAAARQPQPELHLQVDKRTEYDYVARLLSAASRHGLGKVAFVTEPAR